MKLVAVTSCPTGIAHTYMAAEALEQAGRAAGHEIQVETQGAAGANPLPPEVIAAADAVIFGVDVEVRDRHRFEGKPIIQVPVKKAISDASAIIEQAVEAARNAPASPVAAAASPLTASGPALASKVTGDAGAGTRIRQWLMTGVSYMIPFVAAGFLGGFIALWFARRNVPKAVRGVMPVVVIPLVSTLLTGAIMLIVLGHPLKWVSDELTKGLGDMNGANAVILGVVLGLMMAFDMGGPVNKVAYTFATTGLAAAGTATSAPQLKIMAAVMAAGMTPPLGLALATRLRPSLFSEPERENGNAAWLLGASFITEGAIPFAAVDPLRVIPSLMIGSGITGGMVMGFGCTLRAPHGGLWVTPLIGRVFPYLIALVIGTVVTAVVVVALKQFGRRAADDTVAREAVTV